MSDQPGAQTRPRAQFPAVFSIFEPAPPRPLISTDTAVIEKNYRYWQNRILISTIIGYALFYFVRKNLSMAMPEMGQELGIGKKELGMFLTLHGLLYGVSKFAHGFVGDRANARTLMAAGLALSAVVNVFFGLSSAVVAFGVFWMANGWVQGIGFPPCARLMTHWFPPKVLATKMAVWNTSHSIGAGIVAVLCGYLVAYNWRLCFFVPAGIAIAGAVFLLWALRDTPPSLGLPEAEGTGPESHGTGTHHADHSATMMRLVFKNPVIWLIALANFFVYTVRYGVLDWGPTLLKETKGMELTKAGWMVAAFEISGVMGMLASGWLTDRVFGGRGARTCVFFMAMATVFVGLLWKLPNQSAPMCAALLAGAGFFIYGPQALVGVIVANLATKHAAATAVGLTGIFGYASTVLSGVGFGALVDAYGWNAGYLVLVSLGGIGGLLFAIAWPAKPHGYKTH